jgi:hypothetical protein
VITGKVPAGRESDAIVHEVDTFTTLALLAGAEVPADTRNRHRLAHNPEVAGSNPAGAHTSMQVRDCFHQILDQRAKYMPNVVANLASQTSWLARRSQVRWILSFFAKLWRAHINWMFSATREEPPREYGMMWSKRKLSVLPHSTHLRWSRCHTARFTSEGIWQTCSRRGSRASTTGVASGSISSRNLNTIRLLDSSRQASAARISVARW